MEANPSYLESEDRQVQSILDGGDELCAPELESKSVDPISSS